VFIYDFVRLFNEWKNDWAERSFKYKDSQLIDSVWELVKKQQHIPNVVTPLYAEAFLEEDFYELISVTGVCSKGNCKETVFFRVVKNHDKNILLSNDMTSPDFDTRWSFVTLGGGSIQAYKKGFDILSLTVEYYKTIPDIDIAGYKKLDGTPSQDIGIELSKQYINQIMNLCVADYMRDTANTEGLQLAKDRIASQE
jgi:hypothetical protein